MRYSSSVAFAVALLLFLLPFVEIKCNATPLYEAKGIELVTGFTVKDDKGKISDDIFVGDNRNERQEPYAFAMAAFVLGLTGLVLSFMNFRSRPLVNAVAGALAAICLLALLIQIKSEVGKWNSTGKAGGDNDLFKDVTRSIRITAAFTAWYFLALISFIAAAILSYRKKPIVISG